MLRCIFCIFIFLFFLPGNIFAFTLSGKLTDTKGEPLPYGAIYVKGTSKGTTSNDKGFYSLDLDPGKYTVIFQVIGYNQKQFDVDLTTANKSLDVQLSANSVTLKEAVVTDGEDPAYAVIRNAIKKRKYYLEQVDAFSCDVYIKGLQRVTEHPDKIMGMEVDVDGDIDSVSGIVYLSESVSKFNFKRTDHIKEEMISSKVSGDNKAFSYNRASDMLFNFYENLIEIEDLSERGFVSPIAADAMLFYKYRMVGTIIENDSIINKIEVIPKRKTDPCFRGYIYIAENSWRIYETELFLTKDAQIDFVDTLMINQTFVPIEKDVWMVFMNKFTFNFGFMGLKGNGFFVGVNSNYIIDPDFPKKYFSNEEMHVDDEANKKDSAYWVQTRPVPLTDEEARDYHKRDSLFNIRNSKAYLDSVDRKQNRPKVTDILFAGYAFSKRYHHYSLSVSPLVRAVSYNTVQGVRIGTDMNFFKDWDNNKWLNIDPSFSYGCADKKIYADAECSYLYKPVRFARITLAGGSAATQFSTKDPIPVFVNTLYTLLEKENYMKLYSKDYVNVNWHTEVTNGVMLTSEIEYADRKPLYNTSYDYWDPYSLMKNPWKEENVLANRHFTSNDPLHPDNELSSAFDAHRSCDINIQMTFRYKQKYYTRPNEKIILGSKYPTFGIQYKRGIPGVFGSKTDYDFVKVSVRDEVNLKLFGKFNYYIGAGKFLTKKYLPFMDYYHFVGNRTIWSTFPQQSFQLLDYYTYSTSNWYLEAHAENHFGGFIFDKIPFVKRLHLSEVIGVNYLVTDKVPSYYELYFGADKLGLIRVDFALGYMQNAKVSAGMRIGVRLN
ncbi:MAG: carboxypeptidase-like regulatory domain-containing protein [Bacteroidetes bacterium]|nr:carboxypeptidase-like regulatory domain-containing protein [Bacteroidota bacterium]